MRHKTEPLRVWKKGDRRERKQFAFLKTRTTGDIIVWLESYIDVEELVGHHIYRGAVYWKVVESRHICRPEASKIIRGYSPDPPCLCGRIATSTHNGELMWSATPERR